MECPPTFCSQPILRPGHCCPYCEHKSHSCLNGGPHSNDSSCLHFGIEYQSGQSWAMVDSCTSCDCRVRYIENKRAQEDIRCLWGYKMQWGYVLYTFSWLTLTPDVTKKNYFIIPIIDTQNTLVSYNRTLYKILPYNCNNYFWLKSSDRRLILFNFHHNWMKLNKIWFEPLYRIAFVLYLLLKLYVKKCY